MVFEGKSKTQLLTADESLRHRLKLASEGGEWACDCCSFSEPELVLWRPTSGGDVRISCLECHPYEDPWRYKDDVVVAWLPLHSKAMISHLVRLITVTQRRPVVSRFDLKGSDEFSGPVLQPYLKRLAEMARQHSGAASPTNAAEVNNAIQTAIIASTEAALQSVGQDITMGIDAATVAFQGASIKDIVTAMEIGPVADRETVASGVRFIPKGFSKSRVDIWDDLSSSLKEGFKAELVEVAKLYCNEPETIEVARTPDEKPEQAEQERAEEDKVVSVVEEIAKHQENHEPAPSNGGTLRSILSFFKFGGGRS